MTAHSFASLLHRRDLRLARAAWAGGPLRAARGVASFLSIVVVSESPTQPQCDPDSVTAPVSALLSLLSSLRRASHSRVMTCKIHCQTLQRVSQHALAQRMATATRFSVDESNVIGTEHCRTIAPPTKVKAVSCPRRQRAKRLARVRMLLVAASWCGQGVLRCGGGFTWPCTATAMRSRVCSTHISAFSQSIQPTCMGRTPLLG